MRNNKQYRIKNDKEVIFEGMYPGDTIFDSEKLESWVIGEGKVYDSGDRTLTSLVIDGYAVLDTSSSGGGSTVVPLTGTQIKSLYESEPDTNPFNDIAVSTLTSALQTHQDISGKVDAVAGKNLSTNDYTTADKTLVGTALQPADAADFVVSEIDKGLSSNDYTDAEKAKLLALQLKLDSIPDIPTVDGEYVLTVNGGVSTWDFSSGGALVYDAYFLGSTVNEAIIAISPFVKFDGLTEEDRNAGIDFKDGSTYLVYPMYQNGASSIHVIDGKTVGLADAFSPGGTIPAKTRISLGIQPNLGNPFNGAMLKDAIANKQTLELHYDTQLNEFLVEVM